ncbi:hypothetical protein J7E62_24700 [Variovorax paradoxus]|nr:hypothetical protein [Variovorax paradoxus]
MRLIIDGNSYLNSALLKGTDHDEGYKVKDEAGKEHQVNGAQYGVDNFFEYVVRDIEQFRIAPRQIILVWDGKNAKMRRRALLARYKEGRDKIPEVNEQLNKAREMCTQLMLDLGATVMQQKGMEGDDVIGYLSKTLPGRKVVATGDGDLSVLVSEETQTEVWRLGEMNKQPYGPFPHRFITLYKSLVGDSGDKIPGATGFGDTKFVDLVRIFGMDGLELMQDLILTNKLARLREDVADFPPLQKIIDSADQVAISWRCAELHVEDVNTLNGPLEIQAGMVKTWASLPDDRRVHALRKFYATNTLVHAANYDDAKAKLAARLAETPFFALDIETSATEESEEWSERLMKATESKEKLDALGHELTGMSITFGDNTQHTIYMTVDHVETADVKNISSAQCREVVEMLPEDKFIVIHNRSFEFNVLYRAWGQVWADNGWGGFVPNAIDTVLGGSYVNENLPRGLKERSLRHLGYKQTTYEEVTTFRAKVGTLNGGAVRKIYPVELVPAVTKPNPKSTEAKPLKDIVVEKAITEDWEERQYRMNELPAQHVVSYGCDDTMTTAALQTYYRLVMDLEGTWDVYLEVEQRPQYLTSLANIQGVKVSMSKLKEMERRDDAAYEAGWATLRAYLLKKGWEGTVCPEFEGTLEPADAKLAAQIILPGSEFVTKKRKLDGIAFDLREQFPDNDHAFLLAGYTEKGDVDGINKLVREHFTGEPAINFASPKQMQNLFYNVLGMTPRVFNKLTDKQREVPEMAAAFKKLRAIKDGKQTMADLTPEERDILISKASTDDDLIEFSLARDNLTDENRAVLKAYQSVRSVMTRRSLFYKTYKAIPHWRTGRIHSNMNQCEAVTRRYSSSGPNLQQLPKLDEEGSKFRGVIQPHRPTAVIVSCDFSGQELRLMAHYSKDQNLTACYVGDDLKDVHSLTAAAAAIYLWNKPLTYAEFFPMLESSDPQQKAAAKLLRGDAKTVNFGTQYDMQAAALSIKMKVEEEVAQQFIDAKDEAFPGIEIWKDSVRQEVEELGYATTLLGARRHLQDVLNSENHWERSKAGRQGPNFKIQGSGAEQSKLSMGSMWDRGLFTGRYDAQFIAPIHDECVASVDAAARDHAVAFIKEFHECMAQPYGGMTIPVVSSISIGPDFKHQIECGDFFDEAAIRKALAEIFDKEEVAA